MPEKKLDWSKRILPVRVSAFDELIVDKGLERGSTILISGGCGTGKTTFCLQSLYFGALAGEKGIYLALEEEPESIKQHMLKNYGWDFGKLEKEGKLALMHLDPTKIARHVEEAIARQKGKLLIEFKEIDLPFKPDRIIIDSLSALSVELDSKENYRQYIRHLFKSFKKLDSTTFILAETEQEPKQYSRTGIEEFLADGVIVLYNLQSKSIREKGVEILKLRSSNHEKKIVPMEITQKGINIYPDQEFLI